MSGGEEDRRGGWDGTLSDGRKGEAGGASQAGSSDSTGGRRSAFEAAVGLVLDGDVEALSRVLDADPDLARARSARSDGHYCGYFHGATLLHHVPGNPLIRPLPAPSATLALARALLDAGAEVDAVTLQGPAQPDDIGWTTLGLAATSGEARRAGVQDGLVDLLLAAGADVDARNGGCLMGALYYGESAAAERLAQAGARLDLAAAAGVGDLDRMQALLDLPADEFAATPRLAHYARVPWPADASPEVERAHRLGMALVYAALHGRAEALRLLLEAGADPAHRPPFEHRATALHWAVMGDRPESVRILLGAGADPDARDGEFGSTPAGWAEHLGRARAAEALQAS